LFTGHGPTAFADGPLAQRLHGCCLSRQRSMLVV
jgi:hypothetical protein